jgi:Family of unknown function (DUF6328)
VSGPPRPETDRAETEQERLDREHEQLFHELRAIIPGAEVLFGFLLTVAFTGRFDGLSSTERAVFFVVFLLSGASLALLFAPTAFHRIRFRQRDKERMMRLANREAILAMVLISLSVAGSVYLVTSLAYSGAVGLAAATTLWVLIATLWWAIPLKRPGAPTSRFHSAEQHPDSSQREKTSPNEHQ